MKFLFRRSFRIGRQEDAHEYLIGLLDAMHEGQLQGFRPRPPRSIQETSMVFRIFAGRIRSQVTTWLWRALLRPLKDFRRGKDASAVQLYDITLHLGLPWTLDSNQP